MDLVIAMPLELEKCKHCVGFNKLDQIVVLSRRYDAVAKLATIRCRSQL